MLKPSQVTFEFPDGNEISMEFNTLLATLASLVGGSIAIDTKTGQPVQMSGATMAETVFQEIIQRAIVVTENTEKTPEEIESGA
jgi:hypothetical protein